MTKQTILTSHPLFTGNLEAETVLVCEDCFITASGDATALDYYYSSNEAQEILEEKTLCLREYAEGRIIGIGSTERGELDTSLLRRVCPICFSRAGNIMRPVIFHGEKDAEENCPVDSGAELKWGKTHLKNISLKAANAFVTEHHSHSKKCRGHKFSTALITEDGDIIGVAIGGRPNSRHLDDGYTLEVSRLCLLEGAPKNSASRLYAAIRSAAFALGHRRCITYTLKTEAAGSVKGAGFERTAEVRAASWNSPSRPRQETRSVEPRVRWTSYNNNNSRTQYNG